MYQKGDEVGYCRLMNSVFGLRGDLSCWHWEYKENPFGSLGVFAESEQQIVGHYGLIFVYLKIGDKIVKGAQGVDLAVHPSFRRQGLSVKMNKSAVETARKEEVQISYALPLKHSASHFSHLKVGWSYGVEIPILINFLTFRGLSKFLLTRIYQIIIGTRFEQLLSFVQTLRWGFIRFLSSRNMHQNSENLQIRLVSSFDNRIDALWEEASKDYELVIVRKKAYLNWRYVEKPDSDYVLLVAEKDHKLEGYIVLSRSKLQPLKAKVGYVVDIFAKSEIPFERLIRSAMKYFQQEKMDLIIAWMMKYHLPYRCLVKHSFIPDPLRTGILSGFINNNSPDFRRIYNKFRKRWYFTMGDSDWI